MNCSSCSGQAVSPDGPTGERVCSRCGLVLGKPLIVSNYTSWSPEWHSNWNEGDSETLKEWLTTLRIVSCQLNIPSFPYREEAARTIRKGRHLFTQSQKFGKNKRATVAALIHLILKEYNKMRPIKEICQELSLDSTLVMKQEWILNSSIKTQQNILKIKRRRSKDYLLEFGGKITKNSDTLMIAQKIISQVQTKGGNPIAVASGALYLAHKLRKIKISKEQIGRAFGISARTVDTNERKIRHLLCADKTSRQLSPLISAF